MSRYYEYFASGVEICTPSFTHYKDSVTGAELWPSCLPAYDASSGVRGLLGVSCFDLNVMVDPETLKSESYWDDFVCKVSDLTKQCRQLDLNDCTLERLRRAVGPESTCSTGSTDSTSNATCPCADPACQDNEDWLDEKGYFCDTWVGDDCSGAMESWGYTAGGQQDILVQCKRSCGVCPQISPCPTEGPCQSTPTKISSSACRHTRTNKVTNNLIISRTSEANAGGARHGHLGPEVLFSVLLIQQVIWRG
ncbi:unnamed protein product [Durusdinium trenchii]